LQRSARDIDQAVRAVQEHCDSARDDLLARMQPQPQCPAGTKTRVSRVRWRGKAGSVIRGRQTLRVGG
jgi:hypothetical protein